MAGISLADAQQALSEAMEARRKVLGSQEYRIGDRANKRAMLDQVNADIQYWDAKCRELDPSQGRPRVGFAVPR